MLESGARRKAMEKGVVVFLVVISLLGLAASVLVHIASILGIDLPISEWILHVGLVFVFVPALKLSNKLDESMPSTASRKTGRAVRSLHSLAIVFFAYALLNFGVSMFLLWEGSSVRLEDGSFVIRNHGTIVREVSREEYDRFQSYETRLFSGHWMLFYCMSAAALLRVQQSKCPSLAEWTDL